MSIVSFINQNPATRRREEIAAEDRREQSAQRLQAQENRVVEDRKRADALDHAKYQHYQNNGIQTLIKPDNETASMSTPVKARAYDLGKFMTPGINPDAPSTNGGKVLSKGAQGFLNHVRNFKGSYVPGMGAELEKRHMQQQKQANSDRDYEHRRDVYETSKTNADRNHEMQRTKFRDNAEDKAIDVLEKWSTTRNPALLNQAKILFKRAGMEWRPEFEQPTTSFAYVKAGKLAKQFYENAPDQQKGAAFVAGFKVALQGGDEGQIVQAMQGAVGGNSNSGIAIPNNWNGQPSDELTKRYEANRNRQLQRRETTGQLEAMLRLIPQVKSGMGAETIHTFRKTLDMLGVPVDQQGLANTELMKTKSMDFVMERVADTKGAISEKEMDLFMAASPGLHNTQAGNALIIKFALEADRRAQHLDEFERDLIMKYPHANTFQIDSLVDQEMLRLQAAPILTSEDEALLSQAGLEGGVPVSGDSLQRLTPEELYGGSPQPSQPVATGNPTAPIEAPIIQGQRIQPGQIVEDSQGQWIWTEQGWEKHDAEAPGSYEIGLLEQRARAGDREAQIRLNELRLDGVIPWEDPSDEDVMRGMGKHPNNLGIGR